MGSLVFIAALLGLTSAAPYYFHGGRSIPYSAPIYIQAPQVVHHPVQPIAGAPTVVPQKPLLKLVDVQEATQFHSQDGRGQFLFGYSIPDQARIESRTSDGTVRGSYSYLDPVGRAITVQYVADDSGYHAASNELPVLTPGASIYPNTQNYNVQQYAASSPNLLPASVVGKIPSPVEDTPEVAAAREAHLRAHQAALDAHAAAIAEADAKEAAENGGKTPVKEGNSVTNFEEDVGEQEEVEEEGSDYDKTMDESDEGVVIESDVADNNNGGALDDDQELTYEKDRYPKLQYTALPEQYDPAKVHDEENNAVIVTNPEFANSDSVSTRIGGEEKTEGSEGSSAEGNAGKGAFFYSFRHAVPVYVAVPQGGEEGYQNPYGEPQLARQQPFPPNRFVRLLTAPGVLRVGPGLQPQTSPTLSISERASLLGAVPLAAVHDAQVSPSQRGSIKDHQTLPLYIPPAEIEEN